MAGVKRRIHRATLQMSEEVAATKISAAVRGFLIRRVMNTLKVKNWAQTILDCYRLLAPEPGPLDWRTLTGDRFREQLGNQLETALLEFHAIMFDWPLEKRLELIRSDETRRPTTPKFQNAKRVDKGQTSRFRSRSSSALQTTGHVFGRKQTSAVNLTKPKHVVESSKRRRMGAVTPPKTRPNRPATAAARSRSPVSGQPRPSTAANLPSAPDLSYVKRSGSGIPSAIPVPPASRPSTSSRRASVGPTSNRR